jgi:hypothetical protein
MHRYALCEELCLLQWLNPSFFVFRFFLLLVAWLVIARHNDTLTTYFYLRLMGLVRRDLQLF